LVFLHFARHSLPRRAKLCSRHGTLSQRRSKKVCAKHVYALYPYDSIRSCPEKPFQMPYQRGKMLARYWPVRVAARKWGCSYRAARMYMLRHPELCVLVRIHSPSAEKPRWILTVPAGTPKIPAMKSNPDRMDPEWQRRHAIERWQRRRRAAAHR